MLSVRAALFEMINLTWSPRGGDLPTLPSSLPQAVIDTYNDTFGITQNHVTYRRSPTDKAYGVFFDHMEAIGRAVVAARSQENLPATFSGAEVLEKSLRIFFVPKAHIAVYRRALDHNGDTYQVIEDLVHAALNNDDKNALKTLTAIVTEGDDDTSTKHRNKLHIDLLRALPDCNLEFREFYTICAKLYQATSKFEFINVLLDSLGGLPRGPANISNDPLLFRTIFDVYSSLPESLPDQREYMKLKLRDAVAREPQFQTLLREMAVNEENPHAQEFFE